MTVRKELQLRQKGTSPAALPHPGAPEGGGAGCGLEDANSGGRCPQPRTPPVAAPAPRPPRSTQPAPAALPGGPGLRHLEQDRVSAQPVGQPVWRAARARPGAGGTDLRAPGVRGGAAGAGRRLAVCARSGLQLLRAFGQSFSPKSSLETWRGPDLERSGLQSTRGQAGLLRGLRRHMCGCAPRSAASARPAGEGGEGRGPGPGGPHCILSGCSCGAWYCTKAAPAGAAADSA